MERGGGPLLPLLPHLIHCFTAQYTTCADISLLLLSSLPARGRGKEERGLPRERGGRLIQSGHISDDEEEEEEEMDMVQSASQSQPHDLWSVPCLLSISGSDGGAHNDITRFHTKKNPRLFWETKKIGKDFPGEMKGDFVLL